MPDIELFNKVLDKIFEDKIVKDLDEDDISNLKNINISIKYLELYKFQFHGIHHSQKVMLFSYLIGKHENLNSDEMKILMDASLYHDIGRTNEAEDSVHGLISANKFEKLFKNDPFYTDINKINLLKAIADVHSVDDKKSDFTFENYDLPEELKSTYEILYKILKDADALDRTRFPLISSEFVKEEFLRFNYSKDLIDFACKVNQIYRSFINEKHFDTLNTLFSNLPLENACLHGIGWDFSKLESILDNGILSKYAASSENINISRNFNGNNSDMWISVIDSKDIIKNGSAYELFIKNNIVFYAFVSDYHKGVLKKSEAYSSGLPYNSGLYEDESFVFNKIPKENIFGFIIPKGMMDTPLKDLYYLYCSHNFESLDERVNSYRNYIINITGISFDDSEACKLINELKNNEVSFGKLDVNIQQKKDILEGFNKMTDDYTDKLNEIVASWMDFSFKMYFKLDDAETPTVGMLVNDILKRKKISFEKLDSEETIFLINNDEKQIKKDL